MTSHIWIKFDISLIGSTDINDIYFIKVQMKYEYLDTTVDITALSLEFQVLHLYYYMFFIAIEAIQSSSYKS